MLKYIFLTSAMRLSLHILGCSFFLDLSCVNSSLADLPFVNNKKRQSTDWRENVISKLLFTLFRTYFHSHISHILHISHSQTFFIRSRLSTDNRKHVCLITLIGVRSLVTVLLLRARFPSAVQYGGDITESLVKKFK